LPVDTALRNFSQPPPAASADDREAETAESTALGLLPLQLQAKLHEQRWQGDQLTSIRPLSQFPRTGQPLAVTKTNGTHVQ